MWKFIWVVFLVLRLSSEQRRLHGGRAVDPEKMQSNLQTEIEPGAKSFWCQPTITGWEVTFASTKDVIGTQSKHQLRGIQPTPFWTSYRTFSLQMKPQRPPNPLNVTCEILQWMSESNTRKLWGCNVTTSESYPHPHLQYSTMEGICVHRFLFAS